MSLKSGKLFILFLLGMLLALAIFDYLNHTYIKAVFGKTEPMPSKMGVYYQGYKLGTTSKLKISKDFSSTYLYITLNQRGLHLPKNISVEVKNYDDDTKYVDIIYPSAPAVKYIKTGDVIRGKYELSSSGGISNANQAHIDSLAAKGESLLNSATRTTDALTDLFVLMNDMLEENRENIFQSSSSLKNSMLNFEIASLNIKDLTEKVNGEVTRSVVNNSAKNIEQMTKNFADSSQSINKTSSDFSVLIPKLSDLIEIGKLTLINLNKITLGLGETLRKRFGGIRVLFGQPIKDCK